MFPISSLFVSGLVLPFTDIYFDFGPNLEVRIPEVLVGSFLRMPLGPRVLLKAQAQGDER